MLGQNTLPEFFRFNVFIFHFIFYSLFFFNGCKLKHLQAIILSPDLDNFTHLGDFQ